MKNCLCRPPVLAYPNYQEPFIVSTDASSHAIGAILEQRDPQTKEVHPVAFASRILTKAERNYSVTDREALAVVFALKKYRHYLLPHPFDLYTDHQSLKGLFNRTELTGRWTRWVTFISEYQMKVKYRAGRRNQSPDALSRINHAQNTFDEDDVLVFDETIIEDMMLCHIAHYLQTLTIAPTDCYPERTRKQARSYCLIEERLYRRTSEGPKLWIPTNKCNRLLYLTHDGNGHYDAEATYLLLRNRVWWKGMYKDVRQYVKTCLNCQRRRPLKQTIYRPPAQAPVSGLWNTISIDFAGPLPKTIRQNRYILIAIEHVTNWPIARAFKDALASTVTTFLQQNVIDAYEVPKTILSDNRSQFVALHTRQFAHAYDIKWKTTAAYNPQGNGRIERMVRTIKDSIAKMAADDTKNWDTLLPVAIRGYRTRETRDRPSPFFLMFGSQPRVLFLHTHVHKPTFPQLRAIETSRAAVHRREHEQAGTINIPQRYQVGDQVLLARSADQNRKDRKLNLRWDGPYIIREARPPTYLLMDDGRKRRSRNFVHERRLTL